jgi:Holliday junction DNA helicase RuvA
VGRKTAERLVLELRDKMPPPGAGAAVEKKPAPTRDDLLSALVHLGYSRPEAERGADKAVKEGGDARFEDLLRRSLQILSGR